GPTWWLILGGIARTCSSRRRIIRPEKPMLTRRRYFVWSGGSRLMSSPCCASYSSSFQGRKMAPRRADENVFWSSEMEKTSLYLVMAQKEASSSRCCQDTGASARSRRNVAWGGPSLALLFCWLLCVWRGVVS